MKVKDYDFRWIAGVLNKSVEILGITNALRNELTKEQWEEIIPMFCKIKRDLDQIKKILKRNIGEK